MKALLIAIILGGLGYYMFIYDENSFDNTSPTLIEKTEDQKLRDEFGIEGKSYQGVITDTYNKYKKGINDAKNVVNAVEKRS